MTRRKQYLTPSEKQPSLLPEDTASWVEKEEMQPLPGGLSTEMWLAIFILLPWETIANTRTVSRAWLVLCRDIQRNVQYHAQRCIEEADTLTSQALWAHLLTTEDQSPQPLSAYNPYFSTVFGLPSVLNEAIVSKLSAFYQATEDRFFHPDYSILDYIVRPHMGIFVELRLLVKERKKNRRRRRSGTIYQCATDAMAGPVIPWAIGRDCQ